MTQPVKVGFLVWVQVIISWFHEFEPHVGLHADSVEPPWDYVSLSLSLPLFPTCTALVSIKINLKTKNSIYRNSMDFHTGVLPKLCFSANNRNLLILL